MSISNSSNSNGNNDNNNNMIDNNDITNNNSRCISNRNNNNTNNENENENEIIFVAQPPNNSTNDLVSSFGASLDGEKAPGRRV